ncbi:hypothetical protein B0H19DRAFT_1228228 [Mycena capillaripes]|nr:hypothetical protein B0H19DRAFT_1228228 [Mycena capillaripes]
MSANTANSPESHLAPRKDGTRQNNSLTKDFHEVLPITAAALLKARGAGGHKVDVKFLPQESRECPAEDIVGCSFVHCRCSKDLKVRQLLCQPKCGIFALVLLVFDNVEIHHTFEQVPQDSHSDVMKLAIVPANLNIIARVVHVKFRGACSDFTPTEAVVFRDQ